MPQYESLYRMTPVSVNRSGDSGGSGFTSRQGLSSHDPHDAVCRTGIISYTMMVGCAKNLREHRRRACPAA